MAAVAAVLSFGCVTVNESRIRRGDFIAKHAVGQTVDDIQQLVVGGADSARVDVARKTCTRYSTEYAQVAEERISYPRAGGIVGGLVLMTAGLTAEYVALTKIDDAGKRAPVAVSGIVFSVTGILVAMAHLAFLQETAEREVLQTTREAVPSTECADQTFTLRESVPWELAIPGIGKRSGRTGPSGELALRPAATEILEREIPPLETLRSLASDRPLDLRIQMAKAPAISKAFPASMVPGAAWDRWAGDWSWSNRFDEMTQLRWESCDEVTAGAKGRFGCLWSPGQYASGILTFTGNLSPVEGADHGALAEFRGKAGQRFSYRLVVPPEPTDWVVQVAELQSGTILEQRFSAGTTRLDLSGTLPRDAEYAVVLNAAGKGNYRSVLTLGGRAPRPAAPTAAGGVSP